MDLEQRVAALEKEMADLKLQLGGRPVEIKLITNGDFKNSKNDLKDLPSAFSRAAKSKTNDLVSK